VTPAARSFVTLAVTILITGGAVVAGLAVILNVRDESEGAKAQSEANFDLLRQVKDLSENNASLSKDNATLLRVILAVTGCTAEDTAEQCSQRIVVATAAQGTGRIAEIDCRVRLALANLPPPPAGEMCIR
jgi:hypothetical protein